MVQNHAFAVQLSKIPDFNVLKMLFKLTDLQNENGSQNSQKEFLNANVLELILFEKDSINFNVSK